MDWQTDGWIIACREIIKSQEDCIVHRYQLEEECKMHSEDSQWYLEIMSSTCENNLLYFPHVETAGGIFFQKAFRFG